jgi:hypothetical protein
MPRPARDIEVKLALSPHACSTALGVRHAHIDRWIKEGLLPVHKIGVHRRIWVGDLERVFRSTQLAPTVRKYNKRIAPSC